jgi:hypothetical protein
MNASGHANGHAEGFVQSRGGGLCDFGFFVGREGGRLCFGLSLVVAAGDCDGADVFAPATDVYEKVVPEMVPRYGQSGSAGASFESLHVVCAPGLLLRVVPSPGRVEARD